MKERPILFQGWKVNKILNWDWTKGNMQTRRILKPQPPDDYAHLIGPEMYAPTVIDRYEMEQPGAEIFGVYTEDGEWGLKCPYGQPGDLLWVKETHRWADRLVDGYERDEPYYVQYKADGLVMQYAVDVNLIGAGFDRVGYAIDKPRMKVMGYRYGEGWSIDKSFGKWRPSIFMPRWSSRIDLEIVGVRVERVQEITQRDAIAEGIDMNGEYLFRSGIFEIDAFWQIWDSINAKRGYGWNVNPWVWVVEYRRINA